MVLINTQTALSLLTLTGLPWTKDADHDIQTPVSIPPTNPVQAVSNTTKSIAIVGAGSGGLAVLKTLLDLPLEVRASWDIVLFEQKRNVGGVWLPDAHPPRPPRLPETPLYPRLHTNTPHPTMTYPGFTFPPGTPLFPSHEYVEQYHVDFAEQYGLLPHLRLNHAVLAAGWVGNQTHGRWLVDVTKTEDGESSREVAVEQKSFDHLIVANGHNHYPHVPHWKGEDDWLASTSPGRPKREILHSIFYREPEAYTNRTVLIVGGGASGRDAALQVGPITKTYQSLREGSLPPDGAPVTAKPPISHFTNDSIVFTDGTSLTSVDALILATGYDFLVPFLSRIPANSNLTAPTLLISANTTATSDTAQTLTTNKRYIFPLYEHIFSIAPGIPPTALAFVGLPVLIANCPSDIAQSLFVAHAIADASVLPTRTDMLQATLDREAGLRKRGLDPYYVGHRMAGGDDEAQGYQNALVRFLKKRGRIPDDGKDYVEPWRVMARKDSRLLARAWSHVQELHDEERWLEGVTTEDEWANVMYRLADWQREWEAEHGQGADTYA